MYSDLVLVLPLCLATILALTPPNTSKQYRSDYVYNRDTDAFYKLHIESATRIRAADICVAEGTGLMVPSTQEDIEQLHRMFKRYPDLGELVWVGEDGQAHESAEEHPIIELDAEEDRSLPLLPTRQCDVVTRRGAVETTVMCFKPLPFMCKVDAKDAPYDPNCDVYGTDYTYNATVGSCYKATKVALTWEEGLEECRAEGAHLVVVNSEAERQAVWALMLTAPRLLSARTHWFFFAGFRASHGSREFRTIFNQTLEEAGCAAWSPHEPNNGRGDEDCGSLFKNDGRFNDLSCNHRFACICEKEVPTRGPV